MILPHFFEAPQNVPHLFIFRSIQKEGRNMVKIYRILNLKNRWKARAVLVPTLCFQLQNPGRLQQDGAPIGGRAQKGRGRGERW